MDQKPYSKLFEEKTKSANIGFVYGLVLGICIGALVCAAILL